MAEKKSLSDYPSLLSEWDSEKNKNLNPSVNKFSGRTKLWWKCKKGHSWDSILTNRINGSGCPFCAGKRILKGFNDVLTLNPDLVNNEWDFDKNTLSPSEIGVNSSKKIWWKCLNSDHSYESTTASRKRGRGCPYCANKKVLIGFNDFASQSSELLLEWDFDKNKINPTEITSGSDKDVWWVCANSHSYNMSAYKRSIGRGCPVCAGKIVIFETSVKGDSHMSELWDYEKNNVNPELISTGSNKICWWIGKDCGHSFENSPKFIKNGSGCPFCASFNARFLQGFNDLQTKFPNIAKELDTDKNEFCADEIFSASSKKVWWRCEKGHSWITTVSNRTTLKSSCPDCSMKGTSEQEKEFINFIKSIVDDEIIVRDRKLIHPYELDVYIPSKNMAFEFNGLYWHSEEAGKNKDYHYDKWEKCKNNNVQLIQIWEDDWRIKKNLVKTVVAHKLGLNNANKIYARKTVVKNVETDLARNFLDLFHLQGNKIGCSHLGLFDNEDKIVAILSYKKNNGNSYMIERFATCGNVVGAFSKLLKSLKKECAKNNVAKIITFSDHDISDGGLYEKNGFDSMGESNGGYWYVVNGVRQHRFSYRKNNFKSSDVLLYEENMTERELATLNGFLRIYDSGNDKFEMTL